jgi:hypothetical protein
MTTRCTGTVHSMKTWPLRLGLILALLLAFCVQPTRGQTDDPLAAVGVPVFSTNLPVENGFIAASNWL